MRRLAAVFGFLVFLALPRTEACAQTPDAGADSGPSQPQPGADAPDAGAAVPPSPAAPASSDGDAARTPDAEDRTTGTSAIPGTDGGSGSHAPSASAPGSDASQPQASQPEAGAAERPPALPDADDVVDPYPADAGPTPEAPHRLRYFLEKVEVQGNENTRSSVIRSYVPLEVGEAFDPEDPDIDAISWRLRGTGWFEDVDLSLRRGHRRGWVILVVHVRERNTIVVEQLAFGISEGVNSTRDESPDLNPYVGLRVAETNLLGLGIRMSLSALASRTNQGLSLGYTDPRFLGSRFSLRARTFAQNSRQFFGNSPLVSIECPPDLEPCPEEVEDARNAVVLYRRGGLALGTGRDWGSSMRFDLEWQGEMVNVRARPDAASERRGDEVRPIDFAIERGRSYVSLLRFAVTYDRRNDPGLPSQGALGWVQADAGTRLLGSDYDFLRLQGLLRGWIPLPWGHSVRLSAYGGIVFGDAPFFYKFHVSDLTDLIPSRILEMELDRRKPPNFLGTSVEVMRHEEVALRFDVEYGLPLYRGGGGVRAINAYANVGVYALADLLDLQVAIPGAEGFARVPVDLTFDLGLRMDTTVGVFQFGFSNVLGILAL